MPKKKGKKLVVKKAKKLQKAKNYKCARCGKAFLSLRGLRRHSVEHLRDLEELKMLRQGHVPEETKLGANFKGKNKIIVS